MNERHSTFSVDRDHAPADIRKPAHEALEAVAELLRIEPTEQAAERIIARQAVLQLEEAAQKRCLGNGEHRHMRRTLTAAEPGGQFSSSQARVAARKVGMDGSLCFPCGREATIICGAGQGARRCLPLTPAIVILQHVSTLLTHLQRDVRVAIVDIEVCRCKCW